MLTSIIESELCCHEIQSHNRMSRNLDILQKERWRPAQGHAGHDCTQAMHLPLGVVAPVVHIFFTAVFSAFWGYWNLSPLNNWSLVQGLLTWSLGTFRASMAAFCEVCEPSKTTYKIFECECVYFSGKRHLNYQNSPWSLRRLRTIP